MTEQNQQSQQLVVRDDGPISYLLDTAKFGQLKLIAGVLANCSITPRHLRGDSAGATLANCIRVTNQALRWELDPFSVADESYVIHGRLGYQGKLVAAVINARADLIGGLSYEFAGSGDDRTVTVSGIRRDWDSPRTVQLTVRQGRTENEMWRSDPDQKLCYSGAIRWARRHCPEIVLGVLTDDDVDTIASRSSTSNGESVILGEVVEQATDPTKIASLEARFSSGAPTVDAPAALPAPTPIKPKRKRSPRKKKVPVAVAETVVSTEVMIPQTIEEQSDSTWMKNIKDRIGKFDRSDTLSAYWLGELKPDMTITDAEKDELFISVSERMAEINGGDEGNGNPKKAQG